ncbi:MAG: hypothetical protein GIW95_01670 [Candidatus Eremiobacteraeota bacterium]|nr:hypothetical protein [Candidatus Eremiobacteraeota bacterium]
MQWLMFAAALAAPLGFTPAPEGGPAFDQARWLAPSLAIIAAGEGPGAPRGAGFAIASNSRASYFLTERNLVAYAPAIGVFLQHPTRHWVPGHVIATGGDALDAAVIEVPEPFVQPVLLSTGDLRSFCYVEGAGAFARTLRQRCWMQLPDPWNTSGEWAGGVPFARLEGFFQDGAYATLQGPVPRAIPGTPLLDYESGIVVGMVAERQAETGDVTVVNLGRLVPMLASARIGVRNAALR